MKKIFIILFMLLFAGTARAEGEKLRIAVFDPTSSGTSIDEGTKVAIRELISSTIVNTGQHNIVERSLLEKVMEEQSFSNSGIVDDNQATEIGKLAGANKIILSVVTLTGGRNMLSIKMIDVMTASVERQKVKVVTSGELLDIVEPMTLSLIGFAGSMGPTIEPKAKTSPAESKQIHQNRSEERLLSQRPIHTNIQNGLYVYGIDFSRTIIVSARESNEEFAKAFAGINELLLTEPDKYNFSKAFKREVHDVYPTPAHQNNQAADIAIMRCSTKTGQIIVSTDDIREMVKQYELPHTNGTGVVFIAQTLDKRKAEATYAVAFFDIATRRLLSLDIISGKAGGAGLRNYWANSVYDVLKRWKKR
ncbi:CsgG/HfaB family protein [uncultured Alistipes sp.]|uniref:CsgG/HfaB family protein n=1 Tax=uncultured Alistipes sp. TaxID=538949 RepID=UPI002804097C|nr:CsgG/HfaB family protein [uncultured Alistipes sp.]